MPWADLLRKAFAVDVLACPTCGGRLEVLAFITEQAVARKILDHLGLASQAPPLAPARAPGDDLGPEGTPALDLVDASPDYAAADPGWPD